jgi:hypothetical protein
MVNVVKPVEILISGKGPTVHSIKGQLDSRDGLNSLQEIKFCYLCRKSNNEPSVITISTEPSRLYLVFSVVPNYLNMCGDLTFIYPCIASISLKYNKRNATLSRSIYFYKFLYMFQAVPPPIIRSTKLYKLRQLLSNQYCCQLLSISSTMTITDAVCTVLCS